MDNKRKNQTILGQCDPSQNKFFFEKKEENSQDGEQQT
jgi:hypothetical protein